MFFLTTIWGIFYDSDQSKTLPNLQDQKGRETIMATKKSVCVLFCIVMVSAWILGSAIQAGAETLKGRSVLTATKEERTSLDLEPGQHLAMQTLEGLAFFENGEIAKLKTYSIVDVIPGKGSQSISYNTWTFEDGSTVVNRTQRLMVPDQSGSVSAKVTSEFIKGTGRFEGIKGTGSGAGKNFPRSEGQAARVYTDFTWTYTLPKK